jgi:hypothetical protein
MTEKLTAPQVELLILIRDGLVIYSAWRSFEWDYAMNTQVADAPISVDFRRIDRDARDGVASRVWALIDRGLVQDPRATDGESGTATLTPVGGDALAAVLGMSERFPQLTTCRFCGRVLRRSDADEPWTNYGVAGTTSTQCEKAPNPDDGPMPPHEPGTKILTPPGETSELVDPAMLPKPVIPWIPRSTDGA